MFMTLWSYRAEPSRQSDFTTMYSGEGEWVREFKKHAGFIETRLYRDVDNPLEFITTDAWSDLEAYLKFRCAREDLYERMRPLCAGLAHDIRNLGAFCAPKQGSS